MSFEKLNIDYEAEYNKLRDLMTTKGTDLDRLIEVTGMLFLQKHNPIARFYESLLMEISMRRALMDMQPLRELEKIVTHSQGADQEGSG
ncbi:hypothetical protein LCGC14_1423970 [marine sediment metagenome]|uniref:Uncharacterized protein n=1 Tax=marine sediment metagenome TaxID=412755 RepID=A0A0F9KBL7_9ZZZZ